MATFTLNWTPAGGSNIQNQLVQRKCCGGGFTTLATLSPSANTYTDSTAVDNVVYTYKIVSVCLVSGPIDSAEVQQVNIVCPTVTTSVSGTVITVNLPLLNNDRTYSQLQVLNGTTVVFTQALSGVAAQTVTTTPLSYGTTYTVRVVVAAGSFTKNCNTTVSIGAAPACNPVTGLTVTGS